MKEYYEYNHEEIENIAEKFSNNQFVTEEEIEVWYAYKQAVNTYIRNGESYFEMINKSEEEYSDATKRLQEDYHEAQGELQWIRSIPTYDLTKVAEFITYWDKSYDDRNGRNLTYIFAQRIIHNELTETELNIIRQGLEESNGKFYINIVRQLQTPVQHKHWYFSYNNPTSYHPTHTPMDCTKLYNGKTHYVYIHSATTGRYGETYWISNNGRETLEALPVIKDFQEYDFQIGKFYRITCTDTIHFGKNKKKYVMQIEESDEAEYMEKGFIEYAKRNY